MAQYIDKDALAAELKVRIGDIEVSQKAGLIKKRDADKKMLIFKSVLSLIDTLVVKEVNLDFENELYKAFGQVKDFTLGMCIAKHFFELGMQVSNKAQKGE